MLSFSYVLSPTVNLELERLDTTRNKTLLVQVPLRVETRIRFDNLCRIIIGSEFIIGKSVSVMEVTNILRGLKVGSQVKEDVLGLKYAYDYLNNNYISEGTEVTAQALSRLVKLLHKGGIDTNGLEQIVAFINSSAENAIVKSALLFILLIDKLGENNNSIKVASTVSIIYAYNQGYDFRRGLNLIEYFVRDLTNLKEKISFCLKQKNLSAFIEYYVQVFGICAEDAHARFLNASTTRETSVNLTARQMKILSLFDIPDAKINNKTVQKEFDISQITSSRDLNILYTLGLIIRRGKGRSVYYVRA